MKWLALIKNKCPSCGKDLSWEECFVICKKCSFKIAIKKFEEITLNINSKNLDDNKAYEDKYCSLNR